MSGGEDIRRWLLPEILTRNRPMTIARKLNNFLADNDIQFETVTRVLTGSSSMSAEVASVSGDDLAKAVVFNDDEGYVVAVVPSTHRVEVTRY